LSGRFSERFVRPFKVVYRMQLTQDSLLKEVCGHPRATRVLRESFDTHELFEAPQKFCGFEKEHVRQQAKRDH
jgi:hypothetical protein